MLKESMRSREVESLLEGLSEELADRISNKVYERLLPHLPPPVISHVVQEPQAEFFITVSELIGRLKVSRSTLWRLERDAGFPKPVKVFKNRKVWRQTEIEAWMKQPHSLPFNLK